jgi:hypothetical protein
VASVPSVETTRGAALFAEHDVGALITRLGTIPPREKVFFYPYMPLVPVLAAREHSGRVDVFVPDYTTPQQYADACQEVLSQAQWVVFDRQWTDPRVLKITYPRILNPQPAEKAALESTIDATFETVETIGSFDLKRRLPSATASSCKRS